ncbi:twin-arginine translocation signal domain-containing protein [Haloarcula sp. CBA1127]|uniref:twin-arginine translocation signal domain-containing protein n=1 Tax=Haloarcula sp. CBA1127 TaxID=1765055 RepID=UPI00073E2545|nr:twin-arginine translocation signal domain-containing protein [Haloarcula sp. CBA1127]
MQLSRRDFLTAAGAGTVGALAPGESLHLVTDTRPGDVSGALEDRTSAPPRVAVEQKESGVWALQISKTVPDPAEDVTC